MNEKIWLEVYFDGQLMDNIEAFGKKDAEDISKSIMENGFSEYNESVKTDWLNMGFSDNPTITVKPPTE